LTRAIPDRATVLRELDELRHQAASTEGRVSVLALARRVGLANTTFRRRFQDITARIVAEESQAPTPSPESVTTDSEAKLRQRNRDLQENLELAIAAIQRLTLENRGLREQLEAALAITPIRPGHLARSPARHTR
jgi:transposase-like protein